MKQIKNLNGLGELVGLTRDVPLVILTREASAKQDLHICKYFLQSRQIFSWIIFAFKNKRVRHQPPSQFKVLFVKFRTKTKIEICHMINHGRINGAMFL